MSNFVQMHLCLDCFCNPDQTVGWRSTWWDFGRQHKRYVEVLCTWGKGLQLWFLVLVWAYLPMTIYV